MEINIITKLEVLDSDGIIESFEEGDGVTIQLNTGEIIDGVISDIRQNRLGFIADEDCEYRVIKYSDIKVYK